MSKAKKKIVQINNGELHTTQKT